MVVNKPKRGCGYEEEDQPWLRLRSITLETDRKSFRNDSILLENYIKPIENKWKPIKNDRIYYETVTKL